VVVAPVEELCSHCLRKRLVVVRLHVNSHYVLLLHGWTNCVSRTVSVDTVPLVLGPMSIRTDRDVVLDSVCVDRDCRHCDLDHFLDFTQLVEPAAYTLSSMSVGVD